MQVPIVRTVASTKDHCRAVIRAWRQLYPAYPTQAQCGVLYAQWMTETGGKHCYCWNIGNVKATPAQVAENFPWFDLPGTWEMIAGKRVVLGEGDPGRRFRAYGSLDEAMREHLAFLRNRRYASSWGYVEAGDPDGFARALKRAGYYTADANAYAAIMVRAHANFMRSSAFEDALAEVVEASEAPTLPDFAIVHPAVPLEQFDDPSLDDDGDPPPEAA